jgi:hypothetical protein
MSKTPDTGFAQLTHERQIAETRKDNTMKTLIVILALITSTSVFAGEREVRLAAYRACVWVPEDQKANCEAREIAAGTQAEATEDLADEVRRLRRQLEERRN